MAVFRFQAWFSPAAGNAGRWAAPQLVICFRTMDKIYHQITEIMLGRRDESVLAKHFRERFAHYNIRVLEVYHFRAQRGYQCSIYIEQQTLPAHRIYQISIDEEMFVRDTLEKVGVKENLSTLSVEFIDFHSHAKYQIMWQAVQDISEKQEQEFPDVWKFYKSIGSSAVVFYFTDEDVQDKALNGRSQEICHHFFETIRNYDSLKLFEALESLPIRFDSKEHLEREFSGNLFGYDR
jgi:hypothetical protein